MYGQNGLNFYHKISQKIMFFTQYTSLSSFANIDNPVTYVIWFGMLISFLNDVGITIRLILGFKNSFKISSSHCEQNSFLLVLFCLMLTFPFI